MPVRKKHHWLQLLPLRKKLHPHCSELVGSLLLSQFTYKKIVDINIVNRSCYIFRFLWSFTSVYKRWIISFKPNSFNNTEKSDNIGDFTSEKCSSKAFLFHCILISFVVVFWNIALSFIISIFCVSHRQKCILNRKDRVVCCRVIPCEEPLPLHWVTFILESLDILIIVCSFVYFEELLHVFLSIFINFAYCLFMTVAKITNTLKYFLSMFQYMLDVIKALKTMNVNPQQEGQSTVIVTMAK